MSWFRHLQYYYLQRHFRDRKTDQAPNKPGETAPTIASPSVRDPKKASTSLGVGLYVIMLIGGVATYVVYQYIQANAGK